MVLPASDKGKNRAKSLSRVLNYQQHMCGETLLNNPVLEWEDNINLLEKGYMLLLI